MVGIAMGILLGMYAGVGSLHAMGLRINLSSSEPLGLYWMHPYQGNTLAKGDLIEFCPAIRQQDFPFTLRGACPGGVMPFLKEVIGVPGDLVQVTDQGVSVNGQAIADSQPKDHSEVTQKPLPHWRGQTTLRAGQYWVYGSGDTKNSFDSRYYGPITAPQIISLKKSG
ncbi:MAG: conjugative transfer signal peptidase TraF [Burkholderiaceae bacterium]|nr:conjugative transfer signal peptidase TraF [Burkholderiaceae bacterium]